MPTNVRRAIAKMSVALNTFSRHSNGVASTRDMLHGTLLRYDRNGLGKLSLSAFAEACKALHVKFSPEEMSCVQKWFDSNGSGYLDIEQCTNQLTGADCLTRPLSLPVIPKPFVNTHVAETPGDTFGEGMMSSMHHGFKFGVMPGKCCKGVESIRKKFLLRQKRVDHLAEEKQLIKTKLAEIESQRTKVPTPPSTVIMCTHTHTHPPNTCPPSTTRTTRSWTNTTRSTQWWTTTPSASLAPRGRPAANEV